MTHLPLFQLVQHWIMMNSRPDIVPDLRILNDHAQLPETDPMSLVTIELGMLDDIDPIRKVNIRIHDPESVMIIVTDFQMLQDVMTEISLQCGLERKRPEIRQSGPFDLDIIQLAPLGSHAQPDSGPRNVITPQTDVVQMGTRVEEHVRTFGSFALGQVCIQRSTSDVA